MPNPPQQPRDYRHDRQALMRPEGGAQDDFPRAKRRPPKTCRYNGQHFRAGRTLFPRTSAWDKIRDAVRADFDAIREHLRDAISAPFVAGEQVAVKALDERGNVLMVAKRTDEAVDR